MGDAEYRHRRNENLFESIKGETRAFSGKVFAVDVLDIEQTGGRMGKREVVRHSGGAAILPLDRDGNVYLVRQFRTPFMRVTAEIPAGKLEPGEDPREAAIRELSEETGIIAESVVDLGTMYPTPGYCGEILYLFLATDLRWEESHPDPDEEVEVLKIPLADLLRKIEKNEIHDAKTVIAILKTARRMHL